MISDVLPSASVLITDAVLLFTVDKAALASASFFAISLLSTGDCVDEAAVVAVDVFVVAAAVAVLVNKDEEAVLATVL